MTWVGASSEPLLPAVGPPPTERSDAARNRARVLEVARGLVAAEGVAGITMDRVATESGVGKGTVFRRFGSRAGLLRALLDDTEREFQGRFLSGPPPLGPGAPPLERLVAFGRERIAVLSTQSELLRASAVPDENHYAVPARRVAALHVATLLRQAEVPGDVPVLAFELLAVLEAILTAPPGARPPIDRLADGWEQLVRSLDRPV
ncbi:TetR/AcrR family transcriptional regulator [Herbiconiux sp. CPCC 203407]|uniref:TetR/AcrR family transcriptional regulator n=1 Tax=Herbiconiux oxytropis TaxID=2970915 RepID=A0AA42BTJ2_9MICO|nr:TetR/AcrR family transcriptional regulator [Herbiconiux oxytropis]MCS5723741.1 TetR/AcrR family transcriptional regulator [Herbiconiux oxytropis]MCS5725241.1 TetR/AcrR family transcriptional regulator [Herbiconiux oxytropis]